MKRTAFALSLLAVLTLAGAPAVHADESAQPGQGLKLNSARLNGSKLNGFKFNGAKFNGAKFNGPGIILQGRTLNGPGLVLQGKAFNGPVLQGNRFNGARMNGLTNTGFDHRNELSLVSDAGCAAPQPAREWPLSALTASSVKVRLASR